MVDFRKLNKVTTPEPFTMPSIDFIISQLGEAKFLSKLDLLKGFHQVPLADGFLMFTGKVSVQSYAIRVAQRSLYLPVTYAVSFTLCRTLQPSLY